MQQGIFIIGTSTDVGKTLVTAGIFRAALLAGVKACAVKPVQTGCVADSSGKITAPDTELYQQACAALPHGEVVVLHTFKPACSPHLAARLAGERLSAEDINQRLKQASQEADFVIVEGAGGLLVPLNDQQTMLDLARLSGLPVLVVADNCLGVINHTLLTLSLLRANKISVAGVIMNHCSPVTKGNRFIRDENPLAIQTFGRTDILASIPHLPAWQPAAVEFWEQTDDIFATVFAEVGR